MYIEILVVFKKTSDLCKWLIFVIERNRIDSSFHLYKCTNSTHLSGAYVYIDPTNVAASVEY